MTKLSDPLTLPCGVTLPNRLVKAAMTEGLASPDGVATPQLRRLYEIWSHGGAGMLLSGNIQIDRDHLERPGNVILQGGKPENDEAFQALEEWTKAATGNHPNENHHFWAQISHAGRQVNNDINPAPKAPSAVQLGLPGGKFNMPVALTVEEIHELVESFGTAAKTCQGAGFTGVEIHAAHGYLLSSFLNPRANQRTDDYGGSLENRARMLLEVVRKMRQLVGPKFPIAVKLNSADFQKGGCKFEDSLQVVQWLEKETVDLIEISGGNYEQGAMMNLPGMTEHVEQNVNVAPSTKAREAYFLHFAQAMQEVVTVPLMVVGGFRTKAAMEYALESGAADLIGLARPLCVMTDGPKKLLDGTIDTLPSYENDLELIPKSLAFLKRFQTLKWVNSISAMFWFYGQLESLGQTGTTNPNLGVFQSLQEQEARDKIWLSKRTKGVTAPVNQDVNQGRGPMIAPATVAALGIVAAVGAGYLMKTYKS